MGSYATKCNNVASSGRIGSNQSPLTADCCIFVSDETCASASEAEGVLLSNKEDQEDEEALVA